EYRINADDAFDRLAALSRIRTRKFATWLAGWSRPAAARRLTSSRSPARHPDRRTWAQLSDVNCRHRAATLAQWLRKRRDVRRDRRGCRTQRARRRVLPGQSRPVDNRLGTA